MYFESVFIKQLLRFPGCVRGDQYKDTEYVSLACAKFSNFLQFCTVSLLYRRMSTRFIVECPPAVAFSLLSLISLHRCKLI